VDTLEAIRTRRSVRKFTEEPITREQMEMLLRAAMAAPSATNEQPWQFVVVRDRATLERLSKATPFAKMLAEAAVGLIVAGDRAKMKYPGFWIIDCSAAIQNLLLAAHASGLGGVWLGVHPVRPFGWNVRRIAGLPRHVVPHSLVALGHPVEVPEPVDRFKAERVHRERWGG
jgi:nitroreductase